MEKFNIVYNGRLREGFESEPVRETLLAKFKMKPEQVERLLAAGRTVLKKDMEHAAAYRLNEALKEAGLDTQLQRATVAFSAGNLSLTEKPEEDQKAERAEAAEAQRDNPTGELAVVAGEVECPKCGAIQAPADTCQACGIVFAKFLAMQAEQDEQDDGDEWRAKEGYSYAPRSQGYEAPRASWSESLGAALKVVTPIIVVALIGWRIWYSFVPKPPSKSEIYDYYQDACFIDPECKRLAREQFDQCYEQAEPERMEEFSEVDMLEGFLEFADRFNHCVVYPNGDRVFFQLDELDAALLQELQRR